MARPVEIANRKFISKRTVAERYNVVPRTVDRWIEAKILPPSDLQINKRHYWDEAALDRHDRASTTERGATLASATPENQDQKPQDVV
jgi:hypothetical protein